MIISFTGHRPEKIGGYKTPNPIYNYVYEQLTNKLLELKPSKCITGMALGVDTIAAELCLSLNIPFVAAIPFIGQESAWNKDQQQIYNDLLFEANETFVVSEGGYASWKMQKRNQWMVDNSNIVLAVYDGSLGGTANCINYAKKLNKEVIIINPLDC